MDREMQHREMRTLAASPDYVVGSVHALTEGGSLLIASASSVSLMLRGMRAADSPSPNTAPPVPITGGKHHDDQA
jgi:hypothetical protein